MKIIRLILIFIIGGPLTYLTYKSQFQVLFGESIIWLFLIVTGVSVLFWTLITDIKLYKVSKQPQSFALTIICIILIGIIIGLELKIQNNLNKPTLLRVFYDGDYNGTGIVFKENGTYIFHNSAIGLTDYYYGNYKINGNKITLDKDKIDNIENIRHLEVREKGVEFHDSIKNELFLFQVDENGKIITNGLEYRVTIDNRKL
ncbi:hypothetical protein GCM10022216_17300 [Sphingobacterium kyonggiense]|uniref:Uncharacterized protein n=1 Tax=Sphingobacterium kyonggiense TaxID=714075 RepID=A0ABP7YPH8_9SPHI